MRRFLYLLFLLPVLTYLLGYQLIFYATQQGIRNESAGIVAALALENTDVFHFTAGEFAALDRPEGDDRELRINGDLYDIKVIERDGNVVTVYAYADKAETGLVSRFLTWLERESGSNKSCHNYSLNGFVADITITQISIPSFSEVKVECSHSYQFLITQSCVSKSTPPPDLA
ncbi:MAG: hypothetical protein U0V74_07105 [Chitinophagales bacterium]